VPDKQAHWNRAQHNQEFVASLDLERTLYRDWILVAYFYKALHLVDCFFAARHRHFDNHGERITGVRRSPHLTAVYSDFMYLYDRSRDVRYTCVYPSAEEIRDEIKPRADRIERCVQRHLTTMNLMGGLQTKDAKK
jgi:hypothetical protein